LKSIREVIRELNDVNLRIDDLRKHSDNPDISALTKTRRHLKERLRQLITMHQLDRSLDKLLYDTTEYILSISEESIISESTIYDIKDVYTSVVTERVKMKISDFVEDLKMFLKYY